MTSKTMSPARLAVSPDLEAQRLYVREVEAKGFDFNLIVADAFVRGMRDIGYKSSAWALSEMIDNAIQAEATQVHVVTTPASGNVAPGALAVIDDGHGMDPGMIRLACIWGGGHRTQSTSGFGKYGYGLPSASVSLGKRFTVFSRVDGDQWHKVHLDLDEINSRSMSSDSRIEVTAPVAADLPDWISEYARGAGTALLHGTIVLIENLDRIKPKRVAGIQNDLLEHFGVVYRNFLKKVRVVVNGVATAPLDPLFLDPNARYFNLPEAEATEDRAVALDPIVIEVKDKGSKEPLGVIRVRFSSMPAWFSRYREDKYRVKTRRNNPRLRILEDNNGLIIMREGRQIDVVRSNRAKEHRFSVNNDDRYWGVEIDFPATLDDEFSLTTSKQQIRMGERIWELLKEHGVFQAIAKLRKHYDDQQAHVSDVAKEEEKRRSEQVMEKSEKHKPRIPEAEIVKQQQEGEENLQRAAKQRAEMMGVTEEEAERQITTRQQGRQFLLEKESLTGAPFYRTERRGGTKVLFLNTAHRFYTRLYAPAEDPQVRAALELLLWALAEAELDASDDGRRFYEVERARWSMRLNTLLDLLDEADGGTGLIVPEEPGITPASA